MSKTPAKAPAPAPKQVSAPAPAPVAPTETAAADQTLPPSEGAQEPSAPEALSPAPIVDAAASQEASAAATTGTSGAVVTSASDKVGTVATQAEVKQVAAAKAASVATGAYSPEVQAHIDSFVSSAAKNGFAELAVYLQAMAPGKPVDPIQGGQYQVSLYRTLQLLLEVQGEEFPKTMGVLLKVFADNVKGALGGQRVFRFMDQIPLSPNDREGFVRIVNLLLHTSDAKGREQQLKTIDFPRTLQFGLTESARRNILTFYKK